MSHRARVALALVGVTIVLALPTLTKDLWTPDEPRYALVSQEMMWSGDYLVPHRNNELYREKPPLLFWLIALASTPVGRVTEFSTRVPSVLSAVATVYVTYALARRMYGERTGIWSAAILLTTFRFWWQSNTGQIDMLLTACTTLSLYALWRRQEEDGGRWDIAFHAGLALGLLAKGPPALVFTGLGAIAFRWRNRDAKVGALFWLGLPFACVPAAVWFYLSRHAAGSVSSEATGTFSRQIIDRVVSGVSHAQAPWYYLINAPLDFAPWVFVTPWILQYAWKNRHSGTEMHLLLAWVIPAFVFFHLVAEKRSLYLLPLYPAIAILIAQGVINMIDKPMRERLRIIGVAWLIATFCIAFAAAPIWHLPDDVATRPPLTSLGSLIVAVLCVLWMFSIAYARAWRHVPVAITAQTAILLATAGIDVFPRVNELKTAKPFCAPVRALAADGPVTAISVRNLREEFVFYSRVFHKVVLAAPGVSGLNRADANVYAQLVREDLVRACARVPVNDVGRPMEEERASLHDAAMGVLARSGLDDGGIARYLNAVQREIADALAPLRENRPVIVFAQAADWRWITALAGDPVSFDVVRHENVIGRETLLLANRAASEKLSKIDEK